MVWRPPGAVEQGVQGVDEYGVVGFGTAEQGWHGEAVWGGAGKAWLSRAVQSTAWLGSAGLS